MTVASLQRAAAAWCQFNGTGCLTQCEATLDAYCSQPFLRLLDCAISFDVCPARAQHVNSQLPVHTALEALCEEEVRVYSACDVKQRNDPNIPPSRLQPFD